MHRYVLWFLLLLISAGCTGHTRILSIAGWRLIYTEYPVRLRGEVMPANAQPTYSHGGQTLGPWAAVPGTTVSAGRPVFIADAAVTDPAMVILCNGGNAIVLLEGNGGQIPLTSGVPPAGEWFDVSNGGYSLNNGSVIGKFIPRSVPYWRTRITSIDPGAVVTSYCPGLRRDTGDFVPAAYPPVSTGPQVTNQ